MTTDEFTKRYRPGTTTSGYLDDRAKAEISAAEPSFDHQPTPAEIRAVMGWPAAHHEAANELTVRAHKIAGVSVTEFVQQQYDDQVLPAVVFIHGGAFVGGSVANVTPILQQMADAGALRVFALDYSLAPEHPFPAGMLDVYRVVVALHQAAKQYGIDETQLSLAGDSAGGNLTYTVALLDQNLQSNYLHKLVAMYPAVYNGHDAEKEMDFSDTQSYGAQADQALIAQYIASFRESPLIADWYLQGVDDEQMAVSPINAPATMLAELPASLLIIGEFDPLRLEGEAFFERVRDAGGTIAYIRYDGMVHAFVDKIGDYPQANQAVLDLVDFVLAEN